MTDIVDTNCRQSSASANILARLRELEKTGTREDGWQWLTLERAIQRFTENNWCVSDYECFCETCLYGRRLIIEIELHKELARLLRAELAEARKEIARLTRPTGTHDVDEFYQDEPDENYQDEPQERKP